MHQLLIYHHVLREAMKRKQSKNWSKNHTTRRTITMTALVAMLAIGVVFLAMTPSTAEAARKGSYVYSKMKVTSSSIDGIHPENRVYFAWESNKPLRINVADMTTGQVTLAQGSNVAVTNSDSKVTIRATITESGVVGLNVGDVVAYTADLVTSTATFVNETTGQSANGQLIYANVGSTGR